MTIESGDKTSTLDDELREQFRALTTAEEVEETPVEEIVEETVDETLEEPVTEPAKEKDPKRVKAAAKKAAKQTRAEDGKFAKVPTAEEIAAGATNPGAEAPVEEEVVEEAPVVETPAAPVDPKVEKAPSSWSGKAQAMWKDLPADIKAEVHRREENFHQGLESYKGMAQIGQILDAEIRPYEPLIRAAGTTPQAMLKDFLNTAYILKTGSQEEKASVLLEIAAEYGVDMLKVGEVADQLAAGQPVIDPNIAALRNENQQIKAQLEAQQTERARQEYANIHSEVEAFGVSPGHEYFPLVRKTMGTLMESGEATSYQDAYDKAIWASPEVRAKLQAQQRATEHKQRAEKAALARKASNINVKPRGTPPAAPVKGTIDDTLRAKLREMKSNGEA